MAVGGKDSKIHIYALDGDGLVEKLVCLPNLLHCYSPSILTKLTSLRTDSPLLSLHLKVINAAEGPDGVRDLSYSPSMCVLCLVQSNITQ